MFIPKDQNGKEVRMPKDAYETWLEEEISSVERLRLNAIKNKLTKATRIWETWGSALTTALTQYQQFKKENDEKN